MRIIETANQRIHERSRSETQRAGMGTTVTAAYVGENSVTVAHVGDSRCYRVRDGELERLTDDHSLVGDLVRLGKLTEEQAETHPQRSVITRALGPEPNVMVDVEEYGARAGDLFLVCSDGLTSMVREDKLKPLLIEHDGHARPARPRPDRRRQRGRRARQHHRDPVHARGGRRAGRSAGGAPPRASLVDEDTREYNTFTGRGRRRAAPGRQPPAGPHAALGRDASTAGATRASDEAEAEYRASGTVALSAVRPRAQPIEEGHAHAPPPRRAAPAAPAVVLAGQADRGQLRHRPPGGLLARDAAGLLRRRRRIPRQRRHPLQGASVRPPARDPALLAGPPLGRHPPEPPAPRAARPSPTTSCAPRTTPRAW